MLRLIDTHTHFDVPEFDHDRVQQAIHACAQGVEAVVLIGYLAAYFPRLLATQQQLSALELGRRMPSVLLAPGLHPFYIQQHQLGDIALVEDFLRENACVAIGEIGLDTYTPEMKIPAEFQAQQTLFADQLALAREHQLPVLLHIRRAHADTLAELKRQKFSHGGIAHAFSGGVEEARAVIRLGFKLGVTGQITDPNAKRLRHVVTTVGPEHLVLETDCPDMTPLCCRIAGESHTRNTPANLPQVLDGLAALLEMDKARLASQLWHNSLAALALGDLPSMV